MIRLLNPLNCLERRMAAMGVEKFDDSEREYAVYGCGIFRPGEAFDEFVYAYSMGQLLGIVGVTLESDILDFHVDKLREAIGKVLQFAPVAYAADKLSVDWFMHYAINAKLGGNPAWLADQKLMYGLKEFQFNPIQIDPEGNILVDLETLDPPNSPNPGTYIVNVEGNVCGMAAFNNLGGPIYAALIQVPCLMIPKYGDKALNLSQNVMMNHPQSRFANHLDCRRLLCIDDEDVKIKLAKLVKGELEPVAVDLVERERDYARNSLAEMTPFNKVSVTVVTGNPIDDALAGVSGPFGDDTVQERVVNPTGELAGSRSRLHPRELILGKPLDPSTHYDDDYYAGGAGIIYTKPDGTKAVYHGPGRDWEHFDTVADIFKVIFPSQTDKSPVLVSLGCGFGNDVRRFCKKGWDAWGVDISEKAVSHAPPEVKDRVILGDILDPSTLKSLPRPDILCTFDFWEHIWISEIPRLLLAIYEWLQPGGFMVNIICTRGLGEQDITINKGDPATQENSWFMVAGHVVARRWHWWMNLFDAHGFKARNDLAYQFQVARTENPTMVQSLSWRARNLTIVQKKV